MGSLLVEYCSIVYYIKICKYNFNLFIILCGELAACTAFCRGTNTLILCSCELNNSLKSIHSRKNLKKLLNNLFICLLLFTCFFDICCYFNDMLFQTTRYKKAMVHFTGIYANTVLNDCLTHLENWLTLKDRHFCQGWI